jgi:phosphatidylglycerophosphatase A
MVLYGVKEWACSGRQTTAYGHAATHLYTMVYNDRAGSARIDCIGDVMTDRQKREQAGNGRARLVRLIASVGGVGYAPIISGTFGSLPGLAVAVLCYRVPWLLAVLAAAGLPAGIWAAHHAENFGTKKDPGWVVIDETLGMMVTLAFVRGPWLIWPVGFILFRIFDILKPFPIGRLERLHGGFGIVMDDIVAGIYANLVLQLLLASHTMDTFVR